MSHDLGGLPSAPRAPVEGLTRQEAKYIVHISTFRKVEMKPGEYSMPETRQFKGIGLKPKTKSEQAYVTLRKMIVTGSIAEGIPLDEQELMHQLDFGRTPLREALKRLALENYINWSAHQTPVVRPFELEDLHSLHESRALLEISLARMAAKRAGPHDIRTLDSFVEEMKQAQARGDVYASVFADFNFHLAVAAASRNSFLTQAVANHDSGELRLWYRSRQRLGLAGTVDPHIRIASAIRNGDMAAAEEEVRDHIQRSHERQLSSYAGGYLPSLTQRLTEYAQADPSATTHSEKSGEADGILER